MFPIQRVEVSAYVIPTDCPESDGTFEWTSTTLVVVEIEAGNQRGLGFTYASRAAADVVRETLSAVIQDQDALSIPACWIAMQQAVRNLGRPGIAASAIAAVDFALWDLKARLLKCSVATLLGMSRSGIAAYGSGGFTSYNLKQLQQQLGGWAAAGLTMVKMKIGRDVESDPARVQSARAAVGDRVRLFVDANGACSRKQALWLAERLAALDVRWFEEPVSSDDLEGLRLLRDRAPAGMDIAAGEYGYTTTYFRRMLEAGAVDVLQADATRCAGLTGFLQVGGLCEGFGLPLSAHTAPSLHAHAACAVPRACHVEYFHDHARIEQMLFNGALTPIDGELRPDVARLGFGLELKRADAARFAVS